MRVVHCTYDIFFAHVCVWVSAGCVYTWHVYLLHSFAHRRCHADSLSSSASCCCCCCCCCCYCCCWSWWGWQWGWWWGWGWAMRACGGHGFWSISLAQSPMCNIVLHLIDFWWYTLRLKCVNPQFLERLFSRNSSLHLYNGFLVIYFPLLVA